MADELRPLPYYKWHWQDWRANRTVQRMSYIERGIYRELLDECWSEGFIPSSIDKMADIVGCPSDVMADAWQVLSKCFVDAGEGRLINERLNIERTVKDSQRVTRAINGQKGGHAKSLNEKENEASAKQLPSKCHIEEKRREETEGEKKPAKPSAGLSASDLVAMGVDEQVAIDFLSIRKAKKAPLTTTALKGIEKEAEKAGVTLSTALATCAVRGWQSFKAEWHTQSNGQTQQPQQQTGYKEYRPK